MVLSGLSDGGPRKTCDTITDRHQSMSEAVVFAGVKCFHAKVEPSIRTTIGPSESNTWSTYSWPRWLYSPSMQKWTIGDRSIPCRNLPEHRCGEHVSATSVD